MSDGGYAWWGGGERAAYERAVRARLKDQRLHELLERRPTVTEDAVVAAMCAEPVVTRLLGTSTRTFTHRLHLRAGQLNDNHRWAAPQSPTLTLLGATDDCSTLACGGGCAFVFLMALLTSWGASQLLAAPLALLPILTVLTFVQARRAVLRSLPDTGPPSVWQAVFVAAPLIPLVFVLWLLEQLTAALWIRDLRLGRLPREVDRVVEELLGDDRGTLLVTSSHEGLRSPRRRQYFVLNEPATELDRKMGQLDGGVIAVSGPRGVGKTTLMENCVRPDDFAVFAHAPATYAPHDFLTSLFVTVCRTYMIRAGFDPPEFVRLSYVRKAVHALSRPLSRLLRRLAFAVPSAALVVAGLYATERTLEQDHRPWARRHGEELWATASGFVRDVFEGRKPEAALGLAVAGIALWVLRDSRAFSHWLKRIVGTLFYLITIGLMTGPIISLYLDGQLRALAPDMVTWWSVSLFCLWMFCGFQYLNTNATRLTRVLWWWVDRARFYGPPAKLVPLVALVLAVADEDTRPLLTDPEHSVRLLVFLLGALLLMLGRRPWSFLRPAPRLVVECRDHLYRLQTVQSSSAALTSGAAAQLLTLGSSHTSTLTSVPPNYPALVQEFRELLTRIAADEYLQGHRVVIAVDELDRLGTDVQALAFLGEIKAILGVPHVHYLVSVAEDVGAAFVRRGLPHRDVTDSSLDDVLHVRPCGAAEAGRILARRAPGIGEPYVLLAHALSGGLPRDLIRYGRRLHEIKSATRQAELPDVSALLIVEELSETLAGFRTLLAKQPWQPGDPDVLGLFRNVSSHLRAVCPCTEPMEELKRSLARLAAPETSGLGEAARQLVDEAAAYVYLSLTLLEVFALPDFNPRRERAERSPGGAPELLAEARQELSLSPYTARHVIDGIRPAWGLVPVVPEPLHAAAVVPPPRRPKCERHARRRQVARANRAYSAGSTPARSRP
ncbi:hypothetical protein HLK59_15435 [Streptomyces sp. S3(2020)]|uniref:hypothetical protein n=1 Tax=Streptomyces sp. S3(2020) TaxID=2732044 RepID=UPI0014887C41|nr:hypothetical protein [Streptomyces sp. S3(2020)]NNN31737.1 hypothetical protein [Streptomyces sp. S3(2020)]